VRNRRGSLVALAMILVGALLFLENLDILPIRNIGAYWPVALVVWGMIMIERRRDAQSLIWSSVVIVAGILLVLGNLHIIHVTAGVIWPLLLIAFGLTMLTGKCRWQSADWRSHMGDWGSSTRAGNFLGNRVTESVVFSSAERRVESQGFEGGKVEAVFGGIELDLTNATITAPDRRVVLRADAVFGGIEITVPRTWRVERIGSAVFGSFEDKTVPPRPEPGVEPPTLVIRGDAVFGAVVIKN
jgi:predicted membrane protein